MSYRHGAGLILDLLTDMPEFSDQNAGRQFEGWRLLATGNSTYYAVIRPGAWTNEVDGMEHSHAVTQRRAVIELWELWNAESETTAVLEDLADAVLEHLERYPRLGDPANIAEAYITGGGDMEERILTGNGSRWAVWEIYCDWQDERDIDPAEDD